MLSCTDHARSRNRDCGHERCLSEEREVDALKVVLTIPQYRVRRKARDKWMAEVGVFASDYDADLVVFPESFLSRYFGVRPLEGGQSLLKDLAMKYKTAVLTGFTTDKGYETALYCSPNPGPGETREHVNFKHAISDRVAFQLPDWDNEVEEMFAPIDLRGHRIGVCVCFDMFLPAVIQAIENRGASMFIDLTGDNVQPRMWQNVVGGRSLEAQAPFLCTMGYFATWPGKAISLAYDRGMAMEMTLADGTSAYITSVAPTCSLVTSPQDPLGPSLDKDYSQVVSEDITIALGTGRNADIEITQGKGNIQVTSHGKGRVDRTNDWAYFRGSKHKLALLSLEIEDLRNRAILLQKLPKDFDRNDPVQHLVLYSGAGTAGLSRQEIVALASLRVIEHQVAILVLAGDIKEVLRPTNIQNIMRLAERNGLFGMKVQGMNNLKGPSFPEECADFPEQYLHLLEK